MKDSRHGMLFSQIVFGLGLFTILLSLASLIILPIQVCQGSYFSVQGFLCENDTLGLFVNSLIGVLLGAVFLLISVLSDRENKL